MLHIWSVLAAAAALLSACSGAVIERSACPMGVNIIAARGSYQKPGLGSLNDLAQSIMRKIPGSQATGLAYPADYAPTYDTSEGKGFAHMVEYLKEFKNRCPHTKQVVLGYSQGADVVMDAICGTSQPARPQTNEPLPASFRDSIESIVVWGDPSHVAYESYNRGTSIRNGTVRRLAPECPNFKDRIASYCDTGDVWCDSGHNKKTHGSYGKYVDAATEFVNHKHNL